jgi:2-haloacid dehalogenase
VMIDPHRFEALTFDCYGTLIDWEQGILAALGRLLAGRSSRLPADQTLLRLFARLESEAESGPFRSYRMVLTEVALGFGRELGVAIDEEQAEEFASSVATWPPFADSTPALRALATRYRLAVVSNVDDDLFAGSAALLGVDFEHVVTAQQVHGYKPGHEHFHEVVRRLALEKDRILHVAQSLFHDIAPARELGLTSVWVRRRSGRAGGGATPPAAAKPDMEVPDLASLVTALGLGRRV